jgi:5-methylthioadenosine/S-adenosylhomocysteine deaminase
MRILTSDHVVTMNDDLDVLAHGAVAVEGDSIVEVGPVDDVVAHHPDAERNNLGAVVLMPGLVNAHHHSGMLRGTAESLPVWEWLRLHIDPMHRVLTADEAEASAWLCYAEGILAGTTTVVDMWRFMDGAARAAETLGNRLVSVNYTGHHPDYDYFDSLDDNERMLRDWSGAAGGRVIPFVGLESPFYADEKGLTRAIAMSREYDTALYTHISESSIEVDEFDRRYGKRPMFALNGIG